MRQIFFIVLACLALGGAAMNGLRLLEYAHLWPLIRFAGYSSLLVYSLLMLQSLRYNTRL